MLDFALYHHNSSLQKLEDNSDNKSIHHQWEKHGILPIINDIQGKAPLLMLFFLRCWMLFMQLSCSDSRIQLHQMCLNLQVTEQWQASVHRTKFARGESCFNHFVGQRDLAPMEAVQVAQTRLSTGVLQPRTEVCQSKPPYRPIAIAQASRFRLKWRHCVIFGIFSHWSIQFSEPRNHFAAWPMLAKVWIFKSNSAIWLQFILEVCTCTFMHWWMRCSCFCFFAYSGVPTVVDAFKVFQSNI